MGDEIGDVTLVSAGVAGAVSRTIAEEWLGPLDEWMIRMEGRFGDGGMGDQAIAHGVLTAPRGGSKWLSFLPAAIPALKCVSAVCLALSSLSQADNSFTLAFANFFWLFFF